MTAKVQNTYYQQFFGLKEPLISDQAVDNINQQILGPYREQKASNYKAPEVSTEISAPQKDYIDFYKQNNSLYKQGYSEEAVLKKDDPYAFFKQATNQVERPFSAIKHVCLHPSDPSTIATISVASKFFKKPDLELRELICLTDYRKLTKLRIRNYIQILRAFTKIDASLYAEVKSRLMKIKKLVLSIELLSGDDDQDQKQDIFKVYTRLANNQDIYELEDPDNERDQAAKDGEYDDYIFETAEEEEKAKEELEDKDDEGQEFIDFFAQSFLSQENLTYEYYSQALINEEEKWLVRAKWIEGVLLNFRERNPNALNWVPWIEAKVDSLADLDVLVNQNKNRRELNSQVFYLQEFLEEQLRAQQEKQKSKDDDPNAYLREKYTSEQQVYIEEQDIYPSIKFKKTIANNGNMPAWSGEINLRQKFCLKILRREQDTEYFLSVFKKRNFGNEKIYEKRLNLNGRLMFVRKFEFQQTPGNFLYLSFITKERPEIKEDEKKPDDQLIEEENPDEQEEEEQEEENRNVIDDYNYNNDDYGNEGDSNDENYINQDKRTDPGKETEQRISLIFPIDAQFKNPLLVKPNTRYLGFFGERNFLTYKMVKVPVKSATKDSEGNDKQATTRAVRIYEHDLYNFEKVKVVDLLKPFNKIKRADIVNKRFGRTKEGFYLIKEKPNAKDKTSKSFVFLRGKEEIPIVMSDIIPKNDENAKRVYVEKFFVNEKCDRIFMIYRFKDKFAFAKFTFESKNKRFKQENIDFKSITSVFDKDDQTKIKNFRFRVQPVNNDFLVMVQKQQKEGAFGEIKIFLNETLITQTKKSSASVNASLRKIFYSLNDKQQLSKLMLLHSDIEQPDSMKNLKQIDYSIFEVGQPKSEWYSDSNPLINQQVTYAHPNMFFIYNHDQLYVKDMTQPGMKGYFFLNNFLGITQKCRPLCVQSFRFSNALAINIPIIESKYSKNQFFLRVNQLHTFESMNNPHQFLNGSLVNYQVYTYNEKIKETAAMWATAITNQEGVLDKDIRVSNKNNCLSIEKWEQNSCIQRVLITHYYHPNDPQTRDVTHLLNNNQYSSEDTSLQDKFKNNPITHIQPARRMIIVHKKEGLQVFTHDFWSFTDQKDFSDETIVEAIWEQADDDFTNPIFDVIVDSTALGKLDIYLLQAKGTMRKFTSVIPYATDSLSFVESPNLLKIDRVFYNQQNGKKVSLWEQGNTNPFFIANSILYASQGEIIDLNAEVFASDNKTQVGQDLPSWPLESANQILAYSQYDGMIAAFDEDQIITDSNLELQDLVQKIVTLPMINVRMIPQFHLTQFNHPVAPLVDLNNGFTTVFALNLNLTRHTYDYGALYDVKLDLNMHEMSNIFRYERNINLYPGVLVKYFNGVEQRIPLKERFLKVDRFTISKDGYNIVIQGLMFDERSKLTTYGLFIYKVSQDDIRSVNLVQTIQYAERMQNGEPEIKEILIAQAEVEGEVLIGQYDQENEYDDSKYYADLTAEGFLEKFEEGKADQSDDEPDEVVAPVKRMKTLFGSSSSPIVQQINKQVTIAKIAQPDWLKSRFEGFNIVEPNYETSVHDLQEPTLVSDDIQQITIRQSQNAQDRDISIHQNLRISINENGHLFVVNRFSNKVYFFYQDQDNIYKVYRFVIDRKTLQIENADSSGNHVVISSNDNFIVYDVSMLLDPNSIPKQLNENGQLIAPTKPVPIDVVDFIQARTRPQPVNIVNMFTQQKEVEPYQFQILDCKLINGKIILKVQEQINDPPINYLKIFDLQQQVLVNYFEYNQLMVSGNKRFIWIPTQNMVYDIENNLTTLFMWPGNQICTPGLDAMDVFNVTSDKSVMVTHGILQLAFSLHSCDLQSQPIKNLIPESIDFKSRNLEFYYNIPGSKNLISTIFNQNADISSSKAASIVNDPSKKALENQYLRENYIASLNAYILKNGINDPQNLKNYANYLLSFNIECDDDLDASKEQSTSQNLFEVLFSHKQQRVDIIEDILNAVIQIIDCPVVKCVVNQSFLDFLQNADTSQAFKQYLDLSITQTSLMKNTPKYPIMSNPQGYTLGEYQSPIMDDQFNRKFQGGQNELKKDVTVQYIFLGDLLNTQGKKILDILTDIKFLQIMNIPFLNYIVQYQWKSVQNRIKMKTLYPFFLLLALFTIYTLYFVSYIEGESSIKSDTPFLHIMGYVFLVLIQLAMIGYFIFVEVKQFAGDPLEYIKSFWNYTDLLVNGLCLAVIVLDVMDFDSKMVLRPIASSTLILVWVKLFYYLRAYDSTSQLIRMIIETVKDIRYFLFVLFIGIVGFAGGFYILQHGLYKIGADSDAGTDHLFVGTNPLLAVIYIYQLVMGNFNLGNFPEYEGTSKFEFYFIWFLFVISCLFLVIVLMNLLIAIMSNTFSNVLAGILNLSIREKVLLLSENENLFDSTKIFKSAQFLIIITEKQNSGSQAATVDEQISNLRQQLVDKVTLLETQFASQMTDTQTDLKKKFLDQQEKQKMSFTDAEKNYNVALKSQIDGAISKMNEMFNDMKTQSVQIEKQVTSFQDKVKMIENLNSTIEGLKNDQTSLKTNLYKNLNIKE